MTERRIWVVERARRKAPRGPARWEVMRVYKSRGDALRLCEVDRYEDWQRRFTWRTAKYVPEKYMPEKR